jgi:SWI/SNF-related matrix-associated actin-dependent regulator of chromatin subfamily A3
LVDLVNLRDVLNTAKTAKDTIFRVNINVYGSRNVQKEVGEHLSESKAFLQHPDHPRAGITYDNPHVLALPDILLPKTLAHVKDVHEPTLKSGPQDNFQEAVAHVLKSLKRSSHLQSLDGDQRLKTILLPHQKEGLDFMIQRETGPVPSEFSLWQPAEANGHQCFRHVITKTESRSMPVETGGGILADEMGMGKSLSILSLIARTLGFASDWVDELNASPSLDQSAKQYRSRGTLVVVSSGCKYINMCNTVPNRAD